MMPDVGLRCISCLAVGYVYVVVTTVAVTSLLVTLPGLYSDSLPTLLISVIIGIYFLINVCANYYLVRTRNSFYPISNACEDDFQSESMSSWLKCSECRGHVPPRSHHCPICRRCVTVRDHHCYFTASCIGAQNQRYFLCFLLHCTLGSAYNIYTLGMYLNELEIAGSGSMYHRYVLPLTFWDWIIGSVHFNVLYYSLLFYVCIITCIGTSCFAAWQTLLIAVNSTSHEYTTRVMSEYDDYLSPPKTKDWLSTNIVSRVVRTTCDVGALVHFILPVDLLRTVTRHNEYGSKLV